MSKLRYSEVVSEAVKAALSARDGTNVFDESHEINAETWFAMYQAQCSATDQFKMLADAKSNPVLQERIKDLEGALACMNERYANAMQRLQAVLIAAQPAMLAERSKT